jgi:hypothetical protein
MCFGEFQYIPLLPERYALGIQGYKNFAHPEQTSAPTQDDFSCKAGAARTL